MRLTLTAREWEGLIEQVGYLEEVEPAGNRNLLVTYSGRGTSKASYRLANAYQTECLRLDGPARYNPEAIITMTIPANDRQIVQDVMWA